MNQPSRLRDVHDLTRRVVSHERAWSGPIFTVDDDAVILADGLAPVRRQTVAHHDAVNVVALREGSESSQADAAAEILMVRQYRHPVRAMLWEIPAGLLDVPGESPLAAAQRELAEETDYMAARWDVLVDSYASPGFTTEGARTFLARELTLLPEDARTVREAEEAEFEPTWVRFDDAVEAVMRGLLHNPSTVIGILAAARVRDRGYTGLRPADAVWLRSPESL
ncbi:MULTISPECIES: NUDIX hydrolase [unclassified Actinomyces]|uniref:NUDIX domain-containing protein n=1 Tax=unclassified Actinomyces TaxID=2609248 RepID=UPI0013A6CF9D|nr:NUDIX hydrolase [Actinomyces sp. 594]MBW3069600.1 NUDIX hydrolase [Actinomyces sp. 594]NDR53223.1 NUDIX hydrolase [Actinomyces sp. 565]